MDWQQRYDTGDTPWDLRGVTPPLEALLASGRLRELGVPDRADVAVPGCGRGHDLRAFANVGHAVTGFDIAPGVVLEARRLLALNLVRGAQVHCRDVLGLSGEFAQRFDLVYDYTCFCALTPYLRAAYAREVAAILRDRGVFLALAFPMPPFTGRADGGAGPPHLVRREDLFAAFEADHEFLADFDAEHSAPSRAGFERWFAFRRRPRA